MKEEWYALKIKNENIFLCWAKTEKELGSKIERAFWNWRGCTPKYKEKNWEMFMADRTKVKVTIEGLEIAS